MDTGALIGGDGVVVAVDGDVVLGFKRAADVGVLQHLHRLAVPSLVDSVVEGGVVEGSAAALDAGNGAVGGVGGDDGSAALSGGGRRAGNGNVLTNTNACLKSAAIHYYGILTGIILGVNGILIRAAVYFDSAVNGVIIVAAYPYGV